jgi:hypothetical protein
MNFFFLRFFQISFLMMPHVPIKKNLLIHMGSKMLSLRDNRLKSSTSNKRNRMEFTKIVNNPMNPRNSDRNCFYVFVDYLANQAFLTPHASRIPCLFLIAESTLKVCRSNSDTPCIIFL